MSHVSTFGRFPWTSLTSLADCENPAPDREYTSLFVISTSFLFSWVSITATAPFDGVSCLWFVSASTWIPFCCSVSDGFGFNVSNSWFSSSSYSSPPSSVRIYGIFNLIIKRHKKSNIIKAYHRFHLFWHKLEERRSNFHCYNTFDLHMDFLDQSFVHMHRWRPRIQTRHAFG